MRVVGVDDPPDPGETWDAELAVIAIRRPGDDPAFHRAHEAAELIDPLLAPHAVRIVVTVSGATRLVPKVERTLTSEVLHQIGAASARSGFERPFRPLRMRLGLAGSGRRGARVPGGDRGVGPASSAMYLDVETSRAPSSVDVPTA